MSAIKQRPFAFSCVLFVLTSFACYFGGLAVKIVLLAAAFVSEFLFLFVLKNKNRLLSLFTIPPVILACVLSVLFFTVNYSNIMTYSGKECDSEFVVTDQSAYSGNRSAYTVRILQINGRKVNFDALLYPDGEFDPAPYRSNTAVLRFSEIKNSRVSPSNKNSHLAKGIYLYASPAGEIEQTEKEIRLFPSYYFGKINSFFSGVISKYISGEENSLCQALILGNRDMLSSETKYNFRSVGLSHMLAVSGLHLSILIGSLEKLLEKTPLSKKKRYVLMIFLTFAYAGVTGFSSSVRRAAFMLIVFYLSFLLSKRHDAVTSLCFSAAFICLISPNSLLDVGLWLSFSATYGILTVASPVSEKAKSRIASTDSRALKFFLKLGSYLLFGTVPVLFSLPVIWLSYGEISILSPVSNLLFTPLLLVLMYSCPLALAFFFVPFLPALFAKVFSLSSSAMLWGTSLLADRAPIVHINYSFTGFIIAFLVLSVLVLSLMNIKNKYLYFIPFALSVLVFSVCLGAHALNTYGGQKIVYSNTSDGDSFLIVSNNEAVFCDVSGLSYKNARYCEYSLAENHISSLCGYIVTDYRGNGTDTLKKLSASSRIKTLYLPVSTSKDEALLEEKFKKTASELGIEAVSYDPSESEQISFHGIDITVRITSKGAVNSPSSICVSFASESKTLDYVGLGNFNGNEGKKYLSELFFERNDFLFGCYGKESVLPSTSLRLNGDANLYFPNERIRKLTEKTIPESAETTVTGDYFEFALN